MFLQIFLYFRYTCILCRSMASASVQPAALSAEQAKGEKYGPGMDCLPGEDAGQETSQGTWAEGAAYHPFPLFYVAPLSPQSEGLGE